MEINESQYWQVSDGNDIILDEYSTKQQAIDAAYHWYAEQMVQAGIRRQSEDFWIELYDFEQDKVLESRKFTVYYNDTEAREWMAGQMGWVNV